MAILFDASELPAADRHAVLEDAFAHSGLPIRVTIRGPADQVSPRVHYWQFGHSDLFVAQGEGLRLTRTRAQLRAAAPEAIRVGYQIRGRYTLSAPGHDEARGAGQVNVTDLTAPCEFTQYEAFASTASLQLSFTQLGLPAERIRQAAQLLPSSPVYRLVQGHLAGLCRDADALAASPSAGGIGQATVELIRAMISSAGRDDVSRDSVMHETWRTRIVAFIQQNLADPGLTPERIAQANHISVRQLHKLWTDSDLSLSEWIMRERLEGARRTLAGPKGPSTVSAIGRRWGFTDATHFSRRFRRAYGLSPSQWRRLNAG